MCCVVAVAGLVVLCVAGRAATSDVSFVTSKSAWLLSRKRHTENTRHPPTLTQHWVDVLFAEWCSVTRFSCIPRPSEPVSLASHIDSSVADIPWIPDFVEKWMLWRHRPCLGTPFSRCIGFFIHRNPAISRLIPSFFPSCPTAICNMWQQNVEMSDPTRSQSCPTARYECRIPLFHFRVRL